MKEKDQKGLVYSILLKGKIIAECGAPNGPKEIRELEQSDAIANPMFQIDPHMEFTHSDKVFDISVWKLKEPIVNINPIAVVRDEKEALATLESNRFNNQCRSFGYGTTNDDSYGKLTGAYTPITAASKRTLISDLLPTDDHEKVEGGMTAPGDSGGALICKNSNGQDVLMGIISRGREDFAPHSEHRTSLSIYSSPVFNNDFIQKVSSNEQFTQTLALGYATRECKKVEKDAEFAFKKYSEAIQKSGEYEEMEKGLAEAVKSLNQSELNFDELFKVYDSFYFIEQNSTKLGKNWL